jgi:hypothetical protein
MHFTSPRRVACATIALVFSASLIVGVAQSILDPRVAEFDPSPDHNSLAADGTPLVQSYALSLYRTGESVPYETVSLGKPTPDSDGKIRVTFITLLSGVPSSGVVYEARVSAVGAGGSSASALSNQFSFSSPCSVSIATSAQSMGAGAGSSGVAVAAGSGCPWTATSNAAWLTIASGASGAGNGTVSFSVTANTGTSTRTATLTIGGQTVMVTQLAPGCTYTLAAIGRAVEATGSTGSVTLTAGSTCGWTATSDAPWLTITSSTTGFGNATVNYNVAANSAAARTATLTIGGQAFTLNQAGAPCAYVLSQTGTSVPAIGGTGTVGLTAQSGCSWVATSNAAWLTIFSAGSGSGNGSVTFAAAANTGPQRTGGLTIGGRTFTVTQTAAGCTYTLSPGSNTVTSAGGSYSVGVSTSTSCGWIATSGTPWLTVVGTTSGAGAGTVAYSVAPNSTAFSRSASLIVGGRAFLVSQSAGTCTASLTATAVSIAYGGGSGTVGVTTNCPWTVTTSASWIAVSTTFGTGNGSVVYKIAANGTAQARTGTITLAGVPVTLTQAAAVALPAPTGLKILSSGGQ